jgi:hypothetical protein
VVDFDRFSKIVARGITRRGALHALGAGALAAAGLPLTAEPASAHGTCACGGLACAAKPCGGSNTCFCFPKTDAGDGGRVGGGFCIENVFCADIRPCNRQEDCGPGFNCNFSCCSLGTGQAFCHPRCGLQIRADVSRADVEYVRRQGRGLTAAG